MGLVGADMASPQLVCPRGLHGGQRRGELRSPAVTSKSPHAPGIALWSLLASLHLASCPLNGSMRPGLHMHGLHRGAMLPAVRPSGSHAAAHQEATPLHLRLSGSFLRLGSWPGLQLLQSRLARAAPRRGAQSTPGSACAITTTSMCAFTPTSPAVSTLLSRRLLLLRCSKSRACVHPSALQTF